MGQNANTIFDIFMYIFCDQFWEMWDVFIAPLCLQSFVSIVSKLKLLIVALIYGILPFEQWKLQNNFNKIKKLKYKNG
jgi:hypothetical protein